MLVFREQRQRLALEPFVRRLADEVAACGGCPAHDALVAWLIDCGEVEAAVTDALCAERDEVHELARAFGAATRAAADAVVASWCQRQAPSGDIDRAVAALAAALRAVHARTLPLPRSIEFIDVPVSEGYAYYSLTPEMYIEAAAEIARRWQPRRAYVVGIRSIGTSLAAVVASELTRQGVACDTATVRPRGHPFSRHLELGASLEDDWRAHQQRDTLFIVVDEGPGLSGSSFASAIAALLRLGVDAPRIILMPSWRADVAKLSSADARALWPRVSAVTASFEDVWLVKNRLMGLRGAELRDVSAGAWRADSFRDPAAYPAIHPQHERRKYRVGGNNAWLKWAGLGRYGLAHQARAARIADWGFGPRPLALANGFLMFPHVSGHPLRAEGRPPGIIQTLADYLACIATDDATAASPATALSDMLRVNVEEGLGPDWLGPLDALLRDAPAVADGGLIVRPDGHMSPHEWLLTEDGRFVKTDGFEHGDDHFYPGPTDIAWDVAATSVEWRLTPREEAALLQRYRTRSGDASIERRLPFFRAAYLAFRLGYTSLTGFAAARDRYASALREALRLTPTHTAASSARKSPRTPSDSAADSCDADESHIPPG
jgi:hypothetical protein